MSEHVRKEGRVDWDKPIKQIEKSGPGRDSLGEGILVSKNKTSRYKGKGQVNLRIGIPISIARTVGFAIGDYLLIGYNEDFCTLERTNDSAKGYKLSGKGKDKPSFSLKLTDDMNKVFFPNGTNRYNSPEFLARTNCLKFVIGDAN